MIDTDAMKTRLERQLVELRGRQEHVGEPSSEEKRFWGRVW